jgi:hypothetical protein
MKTKPDLAFMDKVHEWTFNKRSSVTSKTLSRECLATQARLRAKLRGAQRFIVDDAAIDVVAGLSREFDRLESWSFLARLPYDTMWLQFDLHHKVEALRALDDRMLPVDREHVSPLLGYLLFLDTDGPSPVWVAHEFYQTDDGHPFIGMLAYVFDPEGDPMWPIRGSKFWRSPTLSLRKGFPRMPVTVEYQRIKADRPLPKSIDFDIDTPAPVEPDDAEGFPFPIKTTAAPEIALAGVYQPHGGDIKFRQDAQGFYAEGDDNLLSAPSWFINRGAVIVDPWWDHYFAERWRSDPDRVHDLLMHEINECRGAMKFLICLIAAINGLPRDIRPILTRPGKRPVGMNMLPYLGHSHLKITLPRDNRVIYARNALDRQFSSGVHRRSHYVMGHWRVVERGKRVTHLCRHMPTMVENGLGMCENCEMLIRWIKQHTRGKDELGMVDHDYEVTAKAKA